jgi:hypothetical protein|tara:strand:- start:118 stop:261 length:144 start_codon:yes stop_codon:yes gene_type:complete
MFEHPLYIVAIVLVIVAFGGGGWLYRKAFLRGKGKAEKAEAVTTPSD